MASATTVSLNGLNPVNQSTTVVDPVIDTGMTFNTDNDNSVPTTCSAVLQAARSAGSTQNFLNIYKLGNKEMVDTVAEFSSALSSNTIDQIQDVDSLTGYPQINEYLTTIETSQIPVTRLVASCLEEESKQDPKTLSDAKQRYETSKARYESVTADPAPVSYYEGWFPIFRPLKEVSLFVLFAFALVFLILSVLTFMFMQGIELKFSLPALSESSFSFNIDEYKGYIYGGLAGGAIVTVFGIWRKWF
jgi:hypothetical protein